MGSILNGPAGSRGVDCVFLKGPSYCFAFEVVFYSVP